jgi:PAS domain S-box-containing protein
MLPTGAAMAADLEDLKRIWQDLKTQVDELAGERQQYIDFFEQSPEAYVVTDNDGTIEEANGAAVDILQRRRRFLRGKPFAVLVALDQRNTFRRQLAALGTEGSWRTIIEAWESRTEVALSARRIAANRGICWRLQARS